MSETMDCLSRDPEDTKSIECKSVAHDSGEKQHVAAASYSRTLPNQNIAYHEIIDISHDCTRLALFRQLCGGKLNVGCQA